MPNATTLKAMEEAKNNEGEMVSLDEFLNENKTNEKRIPNKLIKTL